MDSHLDSKGAVQRDMRVVSSLSATQQHKQQLWNSNIGKKIGKQQRNLNHRENHIFFSEPKSSKLDYYYMCIIIISPSVTPTG